MVKVATIISSVSRLNFLIKYRVLLVSISESRLITVSLAKYPMLKVKLVPGGKKLKNEEDIAVDEFIAVKGIKARGKRLSNYEVESVEWLEPVITDEPEEETPVNGLENEDNVDIPQQKDLNF
jgi:topoisomerase IV subunit A